MYDYIPNDDEDIKKHMNRLEYLSRLEPGWYDGVGEAPSQLAVDAVKTFIDSCSSCIENLAIFPREEGGLLLEGFIAFRHTELPLVFPAHSSPSPPSP
jgi:hypothetical protein